MRTFLFPPIAWVSIQLVCLLPSHLTAEDAVQLQLMLNDNLWVTSGHFGKCNWDVRYRFESSVKLGVVLGFHKFDLEASRPRCSLDILSLSRSSYAVGIQECAHSRHSWL